MGKANAVTAAETEQGWVPEMDLRSGPLERLKKAAETAGERTDQMVAPRVDADGLFTDGDYEALDDAGEVIPRPERGGRGPGEAAGPHDSRAEVEEMLGALEAAACSGSPERPERTDNAGGMDLAGPAVPVPARGRDESVEIYPERDEAMDRELEIGRRVEATVNGVAATQFECAKLIGQLQTLEMFRNFAGTGQLMLFKEVKENKAYRRMQVPDGRGGVREINTFEEFCELMGTSRRSVDEDLQNLNAFGETFMESAQKMGLGYRDLRRLRKLPEGERAHVLEGKAVLPGGEELDLTDKEAVLDFIEEAQERHGKKERELRAALEEEKSGKAALEKVLDSKNRALDKASGEVIRLRNIGPDEAVAARQERERNALACLDREALKLMAAFEPFLAQARGILEDEGLSYNTRLELTERVSALCRRWADDVLESGIEVDFRVAVYPLHIGTPLRGEEGGAE